MDMARAFLGKDDKPNVKNLPHLPVERFFQTDQPSQGVSISLLFQPVFYIRIHHFP